MVVASVVGEDDYYGELGGKIETLVKNFTRNPQVHAGGCYSGAIATPLTHIMAGILKTKSDLMCYSGYFRCVAVYLWARFLVRVSFSQCVFSVETNELYSTFVVESVLRGEFIKKPDESRREKQRLTPMRDKNARHAPVQVGGNIS